jgi:polysaccharide export outer membrane protein
MPIDPTRRFLVLAAVALAGGASGPLPASALGWGRKPGPAFADIDYATWSDDEPGYRLYPGDEIEVATPSAPELTRLVKVAPDGRITVPLLGYVMAADRSLPELEDFISQAFASRLRRPAVEITLRQAAPMRVIVGGEVNTPGWVEMPGDLDALQAVLAAGGFKVSAKRSEVVVIRRGPGGRPMRRVVNLSKALKDPAGTDMVPLRRFDIVYVPRSSIAEAGSFMTQLRDVLPFSFNYSLNDPYR